jgi:methylase of polypeptide subunit release factors
MDASQRALLELSQALSRDGYHFITSSPETHRRAVARRERARDLRDVFGFSLPFEPTLLRPDLLALLHAAELVEERAGLHHARVRFSSLGSSLYVHAACPTQAGDAVFFGPDTYRFCAFVERRAPRAKLLVDIGCGSGAGGLVAARASGAERVVLADVNARALRFSAVNAAAQGSAVELVTSDVLANVEGAPDLVIANPPYLRDPTGRVYRDGGGAFGEALAIRMVRESLARLAPGGTLLLYTGAPIVEGRDLVYEALLPLLGAFDHTREELDVDVFGEELERPEYERVERIAAIGVTIRARR